MTSFLGGDSELARLIRARDWSRTPLGPIAGWPQSLRTATSLIIASPVPIVMLWGPEGVMIYNDAYSVFAGGRHPALLGSNVREGWPEVAAFNDHVMRVGLAGGTLSYSNHELTLHRFGRPEQVFMNLDYSPVYDESGRPAGVVAIVVETTEACRVQAAAAALVALTDRLRDLEDTGAIAGAAAEVLQSTLRASRVGYGTVDSATDTLHVERDWAMPPLRSLAGTTRLRDLGGFLGSLKADDVVVVGDVRDDPRTAAAAAGLEGDGIRALVAVPVVEQGRLVAVLAIADDRPRDWDARALALIREVAGRTRTAVERARGQAALKASEALFRFLDAMGREVAKTRDADEVLAITTRMTGEHLGISNCAYADMDDDGDGFTIRGDWHAPGSPSIVGHYRLADFGRLAVRELGAGRPLIINDNLAELPPEEARTFQRIGIAATICMPLVKDGRLTALMAVHDRRPRSWSSHELTVTREVTERSWAHVERVGTLAELRASADALGELNATLEGRMEERTTQLLQAEEALRQSQKMEAVGQLTGGLAHDFNNLLTGIGGSLELVQSRIARGRLEGLDRYIDAAQGALRRAASLTHRLLAFSRRQTLDPKPVDVDRLIGGMGELVRRTVGPSIQVRVAGGGDTWPILADANQLENAVLNLCINARDAMPGGGRLTVATENCRVQGEAARELDLAPGEYVALSVADTGTGMAPEVVAKAFDPFFTTKPLGAGTGLGLSMIYGFARQSGGQAHIDSTPGQGTCMRVYLPRHDQPVPADGAEPSRVAPGHAADGEVVLVIDDEPTIRMLIGDVLGEAGYGVLEASDGPEGLSVLRSAARVDLLVTDVGLPGLNGRQVADAARVLRPGLKVLFVTGYADSAVMGGGQLEEGMSILTKPFQIEALAGRIGEVLRR